MEHLDAMDQLRQGIGLRAYGNSDPLVEYKFEAYNMFEEMITSVHEDVVRYLFKLRLVQEQQPAAPTMRVRQVVENRGDDEAVAQPVRVKQTIGRNDPCPCGSGKKYKRCCGKDA
jgi:preprotein translocase subunit SecA